MSKQLCCIIHFSIRCNVRLNIVLPLIYPYNRKFQNLYEIPIFWLLFKIMLFGTLSIGILDRWLSIFYVLTHSSSPTNESIFPIVKFVWIFFFKCRSFLPEKLLAIQQSENQLVMATIVTALARFAAICPTLRISIVSLLNVCLGV